MEALTAVQVALLTIYDMCKAVDRGMTITGVRLLEKQGGKSGSFVDALSGRGLRRCRGQLRRLRPLRVLARKRRPEARQVQQRFLVARPARAALSISFSITRGSGE